MTHDSDAGASEGKPVGPMPDWCAYCGSVLPGVHDRMWEQMLTVEGKVAAGNFCRNGGKCERMAQREAQDVAAYLAHRQQTDELWEEKPFD